MKQTKIRMTALILGSVMLLGSLAACKGNDPNTDHPSDEELVTFLKDGASDYSIVYALDDDQSGLYLTACYNLETAILETTGVDLPVCADLSDQAKETGGKEILVGTTNRPESGETLAGLRADDYVIRVSGEKLVIVGGSAQKTVEAVNRFIALYFSAPQTNLILAADYRYEKMGSYALDTVELGGKNLTEYRIVYADGCEIPAQVLETKIRERCGVDLPTVSDREPEQECEILVGATSRAQSDISLSAGQYQIRLSDSKLVIAGGDLNGVGCGVNALLSGPLSGTESEIKLTELNTSGNIDTAASLKIMDLNVTLSGYAENAVVNRYPRLYSQIQTVKPDVICLQEVSGTTWYDCITKGIGSTPALTDSYAFVGTPRNGTEPDYSAGLTGAYNAILYNKSLYKEEESGTFWLSNSPTVPSVGWDGRTRAICTWVRLTELSSGRTFAVMNTQPDSYGKKAPTNGMNLVCETAASFDCPVILCADLSSDSTGAPYRAASAGGFLDCAAVAETAENVGGTYNGYGSQTSDKPSDFIFTFLGKTTVSRYERITDTVDGGYVSEHFALLAQINY